MGYYEDEYRLTGNTITQMVCTLLAALLLLFTPWAMMSVGGETEYFDTIAKSFPWKIREWEDSIFYIFFGIGILNIILKFFKRSTWLTAIYAALLVYFIIRLFEGQASAERELNHYFWGHSVHVYLTPWAILLIMTEIVMIISVIIGFANSPKNRAEGEDDEDNNDTVNEAPVVGPIGMAPSADAKYCYACGASLAPGALFCTQCGTKQHSAALQEAPAQQVTMEPAATRAPQGYEADDEEYYDDEEPDNHRTWWYIAGGTAAVLLLGGLFVYLTNSGKRAEADDDDDVDNIEMLKSEITSKDFRYAVRLESGEKTLFAEADGQEISTGFGMPNIGGADFELLHQADYDGDGRQEALVQGYGGGDYVEPPYIVYYDRTARDFKTAFGFEGFGEVLPVRTRGKWEFMMKEGLRTERYSYERHQLKLVSRETAVTAQAVATFGIRQLFPDDEEREKTIRADIDRDGEKDRITFYHDTSRAMDWGECMLLQELSCGGGHARNIGIPGTTIKFLETKTSGMPDILSSDTWLYKWNGAKYVQVDSEDEVPELSSFELPFYEETVEDDEF